LWPALLTLPCAVAGAALAWQHPLSGTAAALLFVAASVACTRWPAAWLTALPALLPISGLAPWTGWLTFEEWDLMVMAAATGGYARLLLNRAPFPPSREARPPLLAACFVLLYATALLLSTWRGLDAAGGFSFGLFQGYREPMNSIRLAKSFFAALLLFPLWTAEHRQDAGKTSLRLSDGLVLGLLSTSLAAAWERAAFTDLLNFSSDYRTTALFWEMHVGGAALDGMLALSAPFLVAALMRGGTPLRWGLTAAAAPVAAYAALTTFSRGVYLAVPLGAVLCWLMQARQSRQHASATTPVRLGAGVTALALLLAFSAAAAWMFPTSGYRGLLALLTCMVLVLGLPGVLRQRPWSVWAMGLLGGASLAAMAAGAWMLSGRLVYVAFGTIALLALAAACWQAWKPAGANPKLLPAVSLATFVALLPSLAAVAQHWGGAAAATAAWPVLVLVPALMLAGVASPTRWWPQDLRWQAATAVSMGLAALVVAAFLAGGYMQERFATSGEDMSGRVAHWRRSLATLSTWGDWALGRGTGRFVDEQALVAAAQDKPGDYRLGAEGGHQHLTLVAGTHMLGWGEMERVAQRIAEPHGAPLLTLRVRSAVPVLLHFDICFKHLLYDGGCVVKQLRLPAQPGQWQEGRVSFDGELRAPGDAWLPRFVSFSVSSEVPAQRVDIRDLDLRDADGRHLLSNGDFAQGLAHWFMSSDRLHMPWHMKNMAAHVLFEQGAAGLLLLASLTVGALARTTLGAARGHPLSPAVAGGLAGFLAVGLFDSLLDVPRVSFLFYLLVLLGLTLKAAPMIHAAEQQHPDPRNA
jgi:hypothetical protein